MNAYSNHDDHHYDHHDARYNLSKIAEHLILLQDHYAGNRCADCIIKHLYTVRAYADEGSTLNSASEYRPLLDEANALANAHLSIVTSNVRGETQLSEGGLNELINDVRRLRQKILTVLHGFITDEHHVSHEHEEVAALVPLLVRALAE